MKTFCIVRFCNHEKTGVFGELFLDGRFLGFTMEQPWRDNEPYISCVPAGVYTLKAFNSPKYGPTFAMVNPELHVEMQQNRKDASIRFACLFAHAANEATQLQGCVAIGTDLGFGDADKDGVPHWSITSSGAAVKRILPMVADGDTLHIMWKEYG